MARLRAQVLSIDDTFSTQVASLLRSASVPVGVATGGSRHELRVDTDIVVVDGRGDTGEAIASVEQLRAGSSAVAIFLVSAATTPDVILQAMRAGANEFLPWPVEPAPLDEAVRRTSARRTAQPGRKSDATTIVFIGAKGGVGTTTVAVNCGVEAARLDKRSTILVDLKAGLGEVALFTGVRNNYSIIDAIDNLHRLDAEFLRELPVRHKSGLEILAGSDLFERPGPTDSSAVEEVFRLLGQQYDRILVDAGCQLNACVVPVLYSADMSFVITNPDVPSVRNAQRMLERIRKLGPCSERVHVVLNRTAVPHQLPIPQIEAALGCAIYQTFPSDYQTVSAALNSGTPLSMAGRTEIAKKFGQFAKRVLNPGADEAAKKEGRKLGLGRLAASW